MAHSPAAARGGQRPRAARRQPLSHEHRARSPDRAAADAGMGGAMTVALSPPAFDRVLAPQKATTLEATGLTPDAITSLIMKWLYRGDRKSTRLNSSHSQISYAVFCLKKKKKKIM